MSAHFRTLARVESIELLLVVEVLDALADVEGTPR